MSKASHTHHKSKSPKWTYAIGIGSNQPLARALGPVALVDKALGGLDRKGLKLAGASNVIRSRPLGPSVRDYANAVAIVRTRLMPHDMLDRLQKLERKLGRKRARRWGARTIDLDILLWDGGLFASRRLAIPHPALPTRDFVLRPLRSVAPGWRDPKSGLAISHLAARLAKAKRG